MGSPPVGLLFWVVSRPPEFVQVRQTLEGIALAGPALRYTTNIWAPQQATETVMISPAAVELLARGPEDFCEEPPHIPWGAWNE